MVGERAGGQGDVKGGWEGGWKIQILEKLGSWRICAENTRCEEFAEGVGRDGSSQLSAGCRSCLRAVGREGNMCEDIVCTLRVHVHVYTHVSTYIYRHI